MKGPDSAVIPSAVQAPRDAPSALGAHWNGERTRFTVASVHAEAVMLCLFDDAGSASERRRIALAPIGDGLWSVDLPDAPPGQLYGYRVQGRWAPQEGHRFLPGKLLIDPMAAAITGEPRLHPSLFSYPPGAEDHEELTYQGDDSAAFMPKCVVVDPSFDWQGVEPPNIPWRDTVIYEGHVRGLTRRHPEIAEELRGTYLGLVEPPMLEHLKRLGVTTVELMPVQHFASEPHLLRRGLTNSWGYNPLGFRAPYSGYATRPLGQHIDEFNAGLELKTVLEFKTMVRELHRAGLEVILDVVFNHNAEAGHHGPVLSLKGLDNATSFRLNPRKKSRYLNYTGCGNTLDVSQPAVRRMILESLRAWVCEMHVDGFRFDLATTLGRGPGGRDPANSNDAFETWAPLFQNLAADPDFAHTKLIAEPWDLGPDGYRLGKFPPRWAEWNDRTRDTVRSFWRGDPGTLAELATRLAGSRDRFPKRGPLASINYVTCHDGFTLADLVSYEHKHNLANGEDQRDGNNHNLSSGWGHEGPTDDPRINALRTRTRRNLLATLLLSQGVPMLLHGDELGRTQAGNNNAYCQDNATSWVDWATVDSDFCAFLQHLLAVRRRFPTLRQDHFLGPEELRWWHPAGRPMTSVDWENPALHATAMELVTETDDNDLLLLINAASTPARFQLPADRDRHATRWTELVDTAHPERGEQRLAGPPELELDGFALRLYALMT